VSVIIPVPDTKSFGTVTAKNGAVSGTLGICILTENKKLNQITDLATGQSFYSH